MDGQKGRYTDRGRARAAALAVAVPAVAVLVAAVATAQPRKPGAAAHPAAPRKAVAADAGASSSHATSSPSPAPVQGPLASSAGASADAGVVESRTLDGGTHVFKFSELDIEGRLKSPQLVYFLRRVRAEFAAEELGHRTFFREMSETRKEPSF